MGNTKAKEGLTRREFATLFSAGTLVAPLVNWNSEGSAISPLPLGPLLMKTSGSAQGLNILFLFGDQERYFSKLPPGLSLPGHERLQRTGVTFENHYTSAIMCTPSRSVLLTGLQTADNRMFDNTDMPWVKNLSPDVPTIGHMLRKAGYYSAYKGKWHLNKEFDTQEGTTLFTKEMDAYGFSDFAGPGDLIGHTLGGYQFDHLIAGSAITWLRRVGQPLSDQGKPWSLFVSLVNPHDVMYFNTDAPGQKVQDTGKLLKRAAPAPDHEFYKATWDQPVAMTLREPMDAPGRPKAHGEFLKVWDYVLGHIPLEEERWHRFDDFYINSLRTMDAQIANILHELDALGLADRTIVVFTSDHGELAGAHGLHGKGPFAYEEGIHIPLMVHHPDVKGGQTCRALTSHIDMAPTLLAMAGASDAQRGDFAGRDLPGKNLMPVLGNPSAADVHAAREGILFTYSGLVSNDAALIAVAGEAIASGKNPAESMKASGFKPDLKKRGSVRTVFDGRYKFSRYFAPVDRNKPGSLAELYKVNDVELFDLQTDKLETNNLAVEREKNSALISAMSSKLETLIQAEIGKDDGREMPDVAKITWTIDRADL
ncbi:MAG TPA: sulfatase-like hydrolase/transferase [Candidatus Binatia bacterium]|nr:sulfatase-like hydrolase/transferase [Candidatus Binatia bacterium]